MEKVDKIRELLSLTLMNSSNYDRDYKLAINLIAIRDFQGLKELIQSIVTMENLKPVKNRLSNIIDLLLLKTMVNEYCEQLNYEPEWDGEE